MPRSRLCLTHVHHVFVFLDAPHVVGLFCYAHPSRFCDKSMTVQ